MKLRCATGGRTFNDHANRRARGVTCSAWLGFARSNFPKRSQREWSGGTGVGGVPKPTTPTKMKTITKYQALDGSEYTDLNKAAARDALCLKVDAAMQPLGDVPQGVKDGKGWLQHDLETVLKAKDAILEICREEGYADSFPVFKNPGRECHPLSVIGRILGDNGGPLNKAWGRFGRIDAQGREHQQCFYAYTNGPLPEHVCVESRVGGGGGFSSEPSSAEKEANDRTEAQNPRA
jgi:hypothetical protein